MNWLKTHWPAISSVIAGILTFALPSLQAFIAANPKSFVALLLTAIIAAFYKQSPIRKG